MTFELGTLIGPAEAVAVSASKAVPETMEILFVSMTHLLLGLCNTSCEVLQTPVWLLCSAPSKIVEAIPIFALSGFLFDKLLYTRRAVARSPNVAELRAVLK